MNLGLPNQNVAPNRRLRLGPVPWSFGSSKGQGSAVGELWTLADHETSLATPDIDCLRRTIRTHAASVGKATAIAFSQLFGIHKSERKHGRELQNPEWQPWDGHSVRGCHSLESGTGTTASKGRTSKAQPLVYVSADVKKWRRDCGADCSPYQWRSLADSI